MDVEGAAACGDDFHQNLVVCGVCMEEHIDAKSLPCQHNFCEQCLDKSATNGEICCPLCRQQHKLVEEPGGDSIARHELLSSAASDVVQSTEELETDRSVNVLCGGCERSESVTVKYCVVCAIQICGNCVVAHRNFKHTRSHRLLSLEEYHRLGQVDSVSQQGASFCSQHPDEELTHFCETCDVAICKECTTTKHPETEHQFESLGPASAEVTQRLTGVVQEFTAREKALNDSITSVLSMMVSLKEKHEEESEKIAEHMQKTIDVVTSKIEEIGKSLQSQLRTEFDNRVTHLHAELKELETLESLFAHAREFAEQLLTTCNPVQIMSASKWVFSQIENTLAKGTHQFPVANDYMEFQPLENSFEELCLGEVKVSPYEGEVSPQIARIQEEVNISIQPTEDAITTLPTADYIKVTVTDPDDKTEEVRITHKEDSTFSLGSLGQKEGAHKLSVSVYNAPVIGSPFHVHVIPRKGLLRQFGGLPSEQGSPFKPHGVTMTKTGDLLVCDANDYRLQSFRINRNTDGDKIEITNVEISRRLKFAAVSQYGYIYFTAKPIAVFGVVYAPPGPANQAYDVIVCNQNYELVRSFRHDSAMKGLLGSSCTDDLGIAVSHTDGKVYVISSNLNTVNIHRADGTYIGCFGSAGTGPGQFNNPYGVCTKKDGKVLVSDKGNNRIQVFTADGEFLRCFGSQGNGFGQFNAPEDITIDNDGNVYVCDTGNNRVQKFDSKYKYVCLFQSEENEPVTPCGICVTSDVPYGKVIVSDHERGRISVFAQ
ncbi:E3 ubiquitin-protein ligase TRIM71-like [Ptychodera flava]|uniref:E3 ubiquitin-protein ligase TRIM71-like n=1 Tax=Ptychodera flava TaxID=63121 RepID=UPI00396A8264